MIIIALQVWLPLNGDLNNNGVSNATITNNGATVDNSGKLGKCYKTNGSSSYITGTYTATENMSFCIWVKFNSNPAGHLIDGRVSDVGYQPMYIESNRLQTGGSTGGFPLITYSFSTGIWYHLCIVYTSTNVSLYVNGSLVSTTTGGKGYAYGEKSFSLCCRHSHDQYFVNANIQDFRIYDNALSPKEVEIIARGLVVHYPLSLPMPNLAKGSNTDSTSTNTFGFSEATGGSTRTIEYDGGIPCAKITRNSTAHSSWSYLWYSNWDRAAIKPSTTYTLSFDIIGSGSGSIGFSGFMQGNATNNISASVEVIQNTFNADRWSHIVFRTTTIADFTDKGTGQTIYMNCSYLHNTDVWIMMKNMKLEEGVNDTPWIPHTSDAGYSTMGLNDNTEYDTSGYNNHGTKNGGVSYSSDTPRYVTSTYTTNTGYIQGINRVPTSLPTDSLTVNIWVKPTTWGTPISCTEGGGWNFEETGSGLQFQFYVSGVGYKPAKCSVTGASLQDGNWHMLTGTYDRLSKQVKFYIDGTLKATTDSGSTNGAGYANNFLILGGEASGSGPASTAYVGSLSDTRIYATALTAQQVQELYNTAISISNNGTLMGYELVGS